MRRLVQLCFIAVLAAGISTHASLATIYVSGKIVAKDSGKPLAQVTINLCKPTETQPLDTVTSLRNGSYVLKAPGPGIYRITADEVEHATLETTVNVPAAGLAAYDIQLENLPSFRVKVLGPDGLPDAGAVVQVWWSLAAPRDNKPALEKTIAADGEIELMAPHGVPVVMMHEIRIVVRDAQRGCGQRTIESWPVETVSLSLQTGARLIGTVVDENEKPAPHVPVTATRFLGYLPTHEGEVTTTTNDAGQYDIPALFFGTYLVRANIPGVGLRSKQVVLSQPKTAMSLSPGDSQVLPPVFPPFGQGNRIPFLRPRRAFPFYRQMGPNGIPYTFPFPQIPQRHFHFPGPQAPAQPFGLPNTGPVLPMGPPRTGGPFGNVPHAPNVGLPELQVADPTPGGIVPLPEVMIPQNADPNSYFMLVPSQNLVDPLQIAPSFSSQPRGTLLIRPRGHARTPRQTPLAGLTLMPRVIPAP
ncbi:MAG: carboxypeptidase regulatory-like domain-containing protein [Armatimonadota bacterium]|nr:carboxypeptidase regulatory-like domain-containing protein [Armatimonadota bacterium]